MRQDPIAVTGMGVISALGRGQNDTFAALQTQRSGLGPLSVFSSARWGHVPVGQIPSCVHIPSDDSRSMALACAGALDACRDAGFGCAIRHEAVASRGLAKPNLTFSWGGFRVARSVR